MEQKTQTYSQRRQTQSMQTQQAILDAALQLCQAQPFDKVSVRDICRKAGITTGAFYHHFSKKDDLLTQAFSSLDSYMEQALAGHMHKPPLRRLSLALESYVQFMEQLGWQLAARYYQMRLSSFSSSAPPAKRFTRQVLIECLQDAQKEGILSADIVPEWVADFLYRHYRGVVIDWILAQGSYPLQEKLEQEYQFFVKIFHTCTASGSSSTT